MSNNYSFRVSCCAIGFIDFFTSTLSMLLLTAAWCYILLVPRTDQANIWVVDEKIHLLPLAILCGVLFAIFLVHCAVSIRMIAATITELSTIDSAMAKVKFWRGFSIILMILLTINMCVSSQWLLCVPILVRLAFVVISSLHIYELKSRSLPEKKDAEYANDDTIVEYLSYI